MKTRLLLTFCVAIPIVACHDAPTPTAPLAADNQTAAQQIQPGTGLVIHNVTSTPIPLLGNAVFNGDLVITKLALNAVGGLTASGKLVGTISAIGQTINQDFTTDVFISRTGAGNSCTAVSLDLAPINVAEPSRRCSTSSTRSFPAVSPHHLQRRDVIRWRLHSLPRAHAADTRSERSEQVCCHPARA